METSIFSPNRSSIDEMRLMSEAGDLAASPFSDNESALEGMKLIFNTHDRDHTRGENETEFSEKKIINKENTTPLVNEKVSLTTETRKSTTTVISDRAEVSTSPSHNVAHLKNLLYQFGNENSKRNNQIRVDHESLQKKKKISETRSKDTPRPSHGSSRVAEMRSYLDQLQRKNSSKSNITVSVNNRVSRDVPVPMNKVTDMKNFLMDFERRNKKQMSSEEFPSASKQRTIIENRMNKVADLRKWLTQMESSKSNSKRGTSDQNNIQKKSISIPMNRVNDLKNFLLDFERQNKEHNEKHNIKRLKNVTDKFVHSTNYTPEYQSQKDQNRFVSNDLVNENDDDTNVIVKLPEKYFNSTKENDMRFHQKQDSDSVFITTPINSVSNLKNWLLDFERKNKEHYESGIHQLQRMSIGNIPQEHYYLDQNETNSLSRSVDTENKKDTLVVDEVDKSLKTNENYQNDEETEKTVDSRNEKETIFNVLEKMKETERFSELEDKQIISRNVNNQVGLDDNSTVSDDSLKKYLDDLDEAMSHTISNEKEASSSSQPQAPTTTIINDSEATCLQTSLSSVSSGDSSDNYDNMNKGIESNKILIKRDSHSDEHSVDSSQTKGSKQSIIEKINSHLPSTPRLRFKSMKKKFMNSGKKSNGKKIVNRGSNSCINPLGQVGTTSYSKVDSASGRIPLRDDEKDDVHDCGKELQVEDEDVRRMSEQCGPNSNRINDMTIVKYNDYDSSRSDPRKDEFSQYFSPDKSVASVYAGFISPDKSYEEEQWRIATNAKRLPYKKSSKNVSEHVGWLKSVYSSPRAAPPLHPSFVSKDSRHRREAYIGNSDERNIVRYLV